MKTRGQEGNELMASYAATVQHRGKDVLEKLGSGSLFWFLFCCCDQCSDPKQLKSVCNLMFPELSITKGRRPGQVAAAETWRKAADLLALWLASSGSCLASFLM